MPPFVWQRKKSSLYHGPLQNVLSLHHFLIRMFIHGRSFRSKAVKTGRHLDGLSRRSHQGHIDCGATGMLGRLAEGIRDISIVVPRSIPQHQLGTRRSISIPDHNPITMKLHLFIGPAQTHCGLRPQQGGHAGLIKSFFRNRRIAGIAKIDLDRRIDLRDLNQARFG